MPGRPEHLDLWAQVRTGLELDADGSARILDSEEWPKRRPRLTVLGEPESSTIPHINTDSLGHRAQSPSQRCPINWETGRGFFAGMSHWRVKTYRS